MLEITTLPQLPARPADGHKGTFGRVLIVAGSRGMSGAATLAGMGALRGGAGLVQVASPLEVQPIVAGHSPCYLTAGLSQDEHGRLAGAAEETVLELARQADVIALGPGLGQSDALLHLLKAVLARAALPSVVDADGLNALAALWKSKPRSPQQPRSHPLILTPHPGEFARLTGCSSEAIRDQRETLALKFAMERQVVLVLKGHRTLVTDGRRMFRNTTGNPGMATGGTGDVLTGLIAALVAQRVEPFEAAQLGVHLHGRAGDLAREVHGEHALIATDLIDCLGRAMLERPTASTDSQASSPSESATPA